MSEYDRARMAFVCGVATMMVIGIVLILTRGW